MSSIVEVPDIFVGSATPYRWKKRVRSHSLFLGGNYKVQSVCASPGSYAHYLWLSLLIGPSIAIQGRIYSIVTLESSIVLFPLGFVARHPKTQQTLAFGCAAVQRAAGTV